MIRKSLVAGVWALAVVMAGAPIAQAQTTYTWTGAGADSNWSTAANWTGNNKPLSDLANTQVVLAGSNRTTNTLDLVPNGVFNVNNLTQSSTTGFTVNSPALPTIPTTLGLGSGGITVANTGGLTLNVPINITTSQTWATNSTGGITVGQQNGNVSVSIASGVNWTLGGTSTGGITVGVPMNFTGGANLTVSNNGSGNATYTLSGPVTYSGAMNITDFTTTSGLARNLTISGVIVGGSVTVDGSNGGTGVGVGAGVVSLSNGGNAYSGATTIRGTPITATNYPNLAITSNFGTILTTGSLDIGGNVSGIGLSSNAAGNLVLDGGSFRYTGAAVVTDRLFTVTQNGGRLIANGGGALVFTNTGDIAMTGNGTRNFILDGTSTFANTLTPRITDGAGGPTNLIKNNSGYWILAATNTYTGTTTINNGTLQYNTLVSIPASGVALNGGSLAAGFPINQAFLGKVNGTEPVNSSVALGVDSPNNLDFSAANLNVRLGAAPGPFPGTNITYSGTITPFTVSGTPTYRFGNPSGGILKLDKPLVDVGGVKTNLDVGTGGTIILNAPSSFTGSTTVGGTSAGGTLAINRPNVVGPSSPFGTGAITMNGSTLSFRGAANPVAVTGFTQDVIMSARDLVSNNGFPFGISSGIDGLPASANGGTPTGFALFENGIVPGSSPPTTVTGVYWPTGIDGITRPTGLPSNRQVTSAANPLTSFSLAAYDSGPNGALNNNALYLSNQTGSSGTTATSGSLTLSTPGKFDALSLLVNSGNGTATFSAKLNFADGSSTTISNLTSPDWFNNNPFAIGNLGRMASASGTPDLTGINNPRLYPVDIALSAADAAKTLNSIDFTYQGGANGNTTLNIFGVSGVASGTGASTYSNGVSLLNGNASIEMLQTQSITMQRLTISGDRTLTVNNATVGSGSGTLIFRDTTPNSTSDTSLTGNPTFAVNGGTGTVVTLSPGVLGVNGGTVLDPGRIDFGAAVRTITKNGPGSLILGGAGTNFASGIGTTAFNTLTANAGNVVINDPGALGPNPNLNVNATTLNNVLVQANVNTGPYTSLNNVGVGVGANGGGILNFGTGVAVTGTSGMTVNSGTVNLAGNSTTTRLQGNGGTINLGANSLTVGSGNQNDSYAGLINGTGSVIKVGTGTQTLTFSSNTASNYSGGTNITSGKLAATKPGTLGTGAVTIQNNATMSVGGLPGTTISGFNGNGAGWNRQGTTAPAVVADVMTVTPNTGSQANSAWFNTAYNISSLGAGNGAFTASFKYSDVTATNGGADGITFALQSAGNNVTGGAGGGLGYSGIGQSMAFQTNIYVPNNPGINVRTNGAAGTPYDTPGSIVTWNSGAGNEILVNLTYDGGTNYTVTLTQGANTFTKTYTVPTLTSVVNPASVYVGFTGGTGGAQAQQNVSAFSFNWTGTSLNPVSTYTNAVIVPDAASATIATQVITGVSTFTMGGLTMGAGSTLNVKADAGSLANTGYNLTLGATTLAGGATFDVLNNGAGIGTLTLGALNDGGTARAITVNPTGAGTLNLNAAAASLKDGTAVSVNGGTLNLGAAGALGTLASVSLAGSANVTLGADQTLGALTGSGNVALNGKTLTIGSTNNLPAQFDGVIANGSGPGGVTKAGTATLTLTGNNTYTGPTTISAGTLQIGNGGTSGSVAGNITNNATLNFNRSDALSYGGIISGSGAVNQNGPGTLILSGVNTYTGPTTVNAGTLQVGNQSGFGSLGNSAVTVKSGGTLGGYGTINGAVVLQAGSTLSPGASVGTLTVANNVTVTGGTGSTWAVEVNGDPSPGHNDLLIVSGANNNLNLVADQNNPLTISIRAIDGYNPTQGNPLSYTIATVAGSIQSNGSAFNFDPNAYKFQTVGFDANNFQLAVSGNQFVLSFTPVPEPGMVLAIAAGVLGLGAWGYRRLRPVRGVPALN